MDHLSPVLDDDPAGTINAEPPESHSTYGHAPLECSPMCPHRPVDWRWRMALCVAQGRCEPEHPWADEPVRRASRFVAALRRRANPNHRRLVRRFGGVAEAHRFRSAAPQPARVELEARLLAGQNDEAVAGKLGLSPAAVGAYHALFFSVRERSEAEFYILRVIHKGPLDRQLSDDDHDVILKLIGYSMGAAMIDDVLAYWADPPRLNVDFRRLGQPALAALHSKITGKILVTTMTMAPATMKKTMRELKALRELHEQLAVAAHRPGGTSLALGLSGEWLNRCLRDGTALPFDEVLARSAAGPASQPAASGPSELPPPEAAPAGPAVVPAA